MATIRQHQQFFLAWGLGISLALGDLSFAVNSFAGIFTAPVRYKIANAPNAVSAVDLNGDDNMDLVVPHWSFESTTITLLFNDANGNGTFQVRELSGKPPSRSGYIVSADFDGDGDADLAVSNSDIDNLSVFLNNGGGTFCLPINYPVGAGPTILAAGDVDNDGAVDLIVPNFEGTISHLRNQGNGTFVSVATLSTKGHGTNSAAIADLDDDGDLDVAAANFNTDNVSVFLNDKGTLTFQRTYPAGGGAAYLIAAHLNADRRPDLAVSNHEAGTVSVLLNKSHLNEGNRLFKPPTDYLVGRIPSLPAAADVDNDGDIDLMVPSFVGGFVAVFLNKKGSGRFELDANYPAGGESSGAGHITVEDLDRDGDPDLAVPNFAAENFGSGVLILFNSGRGGQPVP